MPRLAERFRLAATNFWRGLREWCGDAAYDRYRECLRREGSDKPLSEAEFYVEQLNRKYSKPSRCC